MCCWRKRWKIVLLLVLFFFVRIYARGEPCYYNQELDVIDIKASCQGTPSNTNYPCGQALDYRTSTLWHPSDQNSAYYILTFGFPVSITSIEFLQYKWDMGHAKKLRVSSPSLRRSFKLTLRPLPGKVSWEYISFPFSVTTTKLKIEVAETYKVLFGGFYEIRLRGCYNSIPRPTELPCYGNDCDWTTFRPTTDEPNQEQLQCNEVFGFCPEIIGLFAALFLGVIVGLAFCVLIICAKYIKNEEKSDEEENEGVMQNNVIFDTASIASFKSMASKKSIIIHQDINGENHIEKEFYVVETETEVAQNEEAPVDVPDEVFQKQVEEALESEVEQEVVEDEIVNKSSSSSPSDSSIVNDEEKVMKEDCYVSDCEEVSSLLQDLETIPEEVEEGEQIQEEITEDKAIPEENHEDIVVESEDKVVQSLTFQDPSGIYDLNSGEREEGKVRELTVKLSDQTDHVAVQLDGIEVLVNVKKGEQSGSNKCSIMTGVGSNTTLYI